jgi:hypothetical protein
MKINKKIMVNLLLISGYRTIKINGYEYRHELGKCTINTYSDGRLEITKEGINYTLDMMQ